MKKYALSFLYSLILLFVTSSYVSSTMVSRTAMGEQKVLVIMTRFPDVTPSISPQKMQEKYFGKLDRYLRDISYEKAWVSGKMTKWYTLPQNVEKYRLSKHNLEVDDRRVNKLIQDTIDLADEDENFSQYSMIFISLGAKLTDYGMMGLCGYPGMLGWGSKLSLKTTKRKQEIPGGVAIYCEPAHLGVVFHDMAHIMGGVQKGKRILPCLYDHDLQAEKGSFRNCYQFYLTNVGYFDPMSCHFYKLKQGPPGVCAWTMMRFNWIEPQRIEEVPRGTSKRINLAPLGEIGTQTQVVKLPIDTHTFYLIENRQPSRADRNLPSYGIIIYYCDDRIDECRRGKSPVKIISADPSIPELKGAPFTIKGNTTYQDKKRNVSMKLIAPKGENYEILVSNGE